MSSSAEYAISRRSALTGAIAAAVCGTMPSFKLDDGFGFISPFLLHRPKRPHVAAFFGRHAGSFYLTAIHVLIS